MDKINLFHQDPKDFVFSLYQDLENDVPTRQVSLAPGESRIFTPHLADLTVGSIHETFGGLTSDLKGIPGWQGPQAGFTSHWLLPINIAQNIEVNRGFRLIPTRPTDTWTVEITHFDDPVQCNIFRYETPIVSEWPVAPGEESRIKTFPFEVTNVAIGDAMTFMAQSALEAPAKPIFSVLVPPASTQLFLTDSDTNGIDDSWEAAFFGTTGIAPEEDADRDGASNVSEFLAGTSPLDGTDFLRPSLVREETRYHLEWPSLANRTYVVEESPDLGEWTGIATVAGTGETCRHDTGERAQESRFYRLRILPLQ